MKELYAYLTSMSLFWILAVITAFQQPIDGTALNFTVEHDSVTVQVGRWKIKSKKAAEMNRFVDTHIKAIDPNKIFIYGDGQAKYPSFRSVIEVLKKHDWLKFKLVDTGANSQPVQKKGDSRHI